MPLDLDRHSHRRLLEDVHDIAEIVRPELGGPGKRLAERYLPLRSFKHRWIGENDPLGWERALALVSSAGDQHGGFF